MKLRERRIFKAVTSGKWLVMSLFCLSLVTGHLSLAAEQPQALTELELLKGENLQLKYDSLDKQMRLIQVQYQQLQTQQAEIIQQLQELEAAILEKRDLKTAEWSVNWPEKRITQTSHRGTENAEQVQEKKE